MGKSKKKKKTCPCCKMNIAGGNSGLLYHMKKSLCRQMIVKCHGCGSEFASSEHLANHQHYQQLKDPNTSCIQGMDKLHHVQILTQSSNQFNVQKSHKIFSVEQKQLPNILNINTISTTTKNSKISQQHEDTTQCLKSSSESDKELFKNKRRSASVSSSLVNYSLQQYNQTTFPNIKCSESNKTNSVNNTSINNNDYSGKNSSIYYGISHIDEEDIYMIESDDDDNYYLDNLSHSTNKQVSFDETLFNEMKEVFENDDYDASDCSIHEFIPKQSQNQNTNSVSICLYLIIFLQPYLKY